MFQFRFSSGCVFGHDSFSFFVLTVWCLFGHATDVAQITERDFILVCRSKLEHSSLNSLHREWTCRVGPLSKFELCVQKADTTNDCCRFHDFCGFQSVSPPSGFVARQCCSNQRASSTSCESGGTSPSGTVRPRRTGHGLTRSGPIGIGLDRPRRTPFFPVGQERFPALLPFQCFWHFMTGKPHVKLRALEDMRCLGLESISGLGSSLAAESSGDQWIGSHVWRCVHL